MRRLLFLASIILTMLASVQTADAHCIIRHPQHCVTPTPTPTPTPSPTPTPTPTPGELFRDDFSGAANSYPDMAKWRGLCYSIASSAMPCDFVNGDNRSRYARLDGGGNLSMPTTTTEGSFIRSYFTFLYGTMTARIKLSPNSGVWSGWWWNNGEAPEDTGEIDTMESVDPNPTKYYISWHRYNEPGVGHTGRTDICNAPGGVNLSNDFHDYRTTWNQFSVSFYIDGQLCQAAYPTPTALKDPFPKGKLMFDTASGGWAGTPGSGRMLVDWVSVTSGSNPAPEPLGVTLTNPADGATVQGNVTLKATATGPVQWMEFWADGAKLGTDSTAPYERVWDTSALNGAHAVAAVANDGQGVDGTLNSHRVSDTANVTVEPPAPSVWQPTGPLVWDSQFETGNFSEWSWDGTVSQPQFWPQAEPISITTPAAQGIPASPTGGNIAKFPMNATDANAGRIHSKLYQWWSPVPADTSGLYGASFFASSYPFNTSKGVDLFQWKDDAGGDPLWWVEIRPKSFIDSTPRHRYVGAVPTDPNTPMLFVNRWKQPTDDANWTQWWNNHEFVAMAMPLGRWFPVRARLYHNDHIDFQIDGVSLYTALQSELKVNMTGPAPSGSRWTLGIGNYSPNYPTVIYADDAFWARP